MGAELVRVPADRCKGWHIPFRLDVNQIQTQNLQAIVSCLSQAAMQHNRSAYLSVQEFAAHTVSFAHHSRLQNPTYSAMSIAQMPVPVPKSRMRVSPVCVTGAWCSMSLRATEKSLW